MAESVVVIGGGGHARVVVEALGSGIPITGYVAPSASTVGGASLGPWLGDDSILTDLADAGHRFALGIGFVDRAGAGRRGRIIAALDPATLLTIVHPAAVVAPSAELGPGVFVAGAAFVGTGTVIGPASIVNSGAVVDHDGRIGRNVHVASGATLSGGVTVDDHTLIGAGATVKQGVRVGRRAIVGAGAVVITDVADEVAAVGVPARPVER